MANTYREGLY